MTWTICQQVSPKNAEKRNKAGYSLFELFGTVEQHAKLETSNRHLNGTVKSQIRTVIIQSTKIFTHLFFLFLETIISWNFEDIECIFLADSDQAIKSSQ